MKTCEMCLKSHDGEYGSGRFCSSFCSRKFSTFGKRRYINEKVRLTINEKIQKGTWVKCGRKNVTIKICPICNSKFETWFSQDNIYCSKRCYKNDKHCEFRSCGKGGYREGSGRGKSGWYKGIYCQSTYELAYVIYNIDHGILFVRNKERFPYIKDGVTKEYIPDFIEGDSLIEIKGYYNDDIDLKLKCVKKKIRILYKEDLKYIFDYVKSKYKKKNKRNILL